MIQFKRLHPNAIVPTKGTFASAGFDLYADADYEIVGGAGNVLVKTGIACKLPAGTYGRIAMRSGLAAREHLGVGAGVIDLDYSGEIMVLVHCLQADRVVQLKRGERIAQLVPELLATPAVNIVDDFEETHGGHAGFGSTGR